MYQVKVWITSHTLSAGVPASNGALGDLMHIPVQCTQEIPTCTQEKPQPLAAVPLVQKPAEHRNPSRNVGTWDLLAEDMSELSLDATYQRVSCFPFFVGFNQGLAQILMSCPLCLCQMPVEGGAPLVGLSDALLMSEVALQSHVCEFCQAIFPGDTTTRGDFLRHLYTHVT